MIFFQVVGMLVTAWFAIGLVVGVAYVAQHTAKFFSAGFRWGAAGQAALLTAAVWPAVVGKVLRGSRGQREDDERRRKKDAAELMESHRHALRQGEWYRDVLGIRRRWFVDAFGREYSPEQDGPTAFRVWEKAYRLSGRMG